MAFTNILQSIGVVEKDEPQTKQTKKTEASNLTPPQRNPGTPGQPLTVADVQGIGEPQPAGFNSEQLVAHLEASIQANPDFLPAAKFLAAVDDIKGVIAEEGLRFRTAQATTKIASDVLITSLQAHDASLQYEARQFEQGVVDPNIDSINGLTAHADQLQSQINELQQQITQLAAEKDQVNADIITSNASLDKAKDDFKATSAKVTQRYGDLAKKVSAYLGAA